MGLYLITFLTSVITYLIVNQPTIAILSDMHDHPGLKSKKKYFGTCAPTHFNNNVCQQNLNYVIPTTLQADTLDLKVKWNSEVNDY